VSSSDQAHESKKKVAEPLSRTEDEMVLVNPYEGLLEIESKPDESKDQDSGHDYVAHKNPGHNNVERKDVEHEEVRYEKASIATPGEQGQNSLYTNEPNPNWDYEAIPVEASPLGSKIPLIPGIAALIGMIFLFIFFYPESGSRMVFSMDLGSLISSSDSILGIKPSATPQTNTLVDRRDCSWKISAAPFSSEGMIKLENHMPIYLAMSIEQEPSPKLSKDELVAKKKRTPWIHRLEAVFPKGSLAIMAPDPEPEIQYRGHTKAKVYIEDDLGRTRMIGYLTIQLTHHGTDNTWQLTWALQSSSSADPTKEALNPPEILRTSNNELTFDVNGTFGIECPK